MYYLRPPARFLGHGRCFDAIQSKIVGQAGTTSCTDTTATYAGQFFYRVGLETEVPLGQVRSLAFSTSSSVAMNFTLSAGGMPMDLTNLAATTICTSDSLQFSPPPPRTTDKSGIMD
jgi:hypothetical protein